MGFDALGLQDVLQIGFKSDLYTRVTNVIEQHALTRLTTVEERRVAFDRTVTVATVERIP